MEQTTQLRKLLTLVFGHRLELTFPLPLLALLLGER